MDIRIDVQGASGKLYNSRDECIYDGQWTARSARSKEGGMTMDIVYHGQGCLYAENGNVIYRGQWLMGLRHGQGHQIYANGAEYIGEWNRGTRHGHGVYIVNDTVVFDGRYSSGSAMKGKLFSNATRSGGDVRYAGDVIASAYGGSPPVFKEHGTGIEFREDGSISYDGEFRFGKRTGTGREFDMKGRLMFKGEFNNGRRNGRGQSYYEDTQKLFSDGDWCDGDPHGAMTEYFKNGRVWFKGRYENGIRQGYGILYDYTGVVHDGMFCDGAPDKRATKRMLREETERKKARQRVISLCEKSKHLVDLPRCAVCITEMIEGDEVYVYTTCGHRVCACVKKQTVDQKWVTCCPTCRADDQSMVRVW